MKTFAPFHGCQNLSNGNKFTKHSDFVDSSLPSSPVPEVGYWGSCFQIIRVLHKRKRKIPRKIYSKQSKVQLKYAVKRDSRPHKWGNSGAFLLCRLKRQKSFVAKGDSMGG